MFEREPLMQIRNNQADGLARSRAAETSAAAPITGAQPKNGGGSGAVGDRVDVSAMADRVNQVAQRDSTVRAEKVSRLENTYLSGQYKVDPAALGDAILQSAMKSPGEG